jgi:toxin CcdB
MQYDVYRNQNSVSKKRFPFLLDVQAELLADLETRVVIPLANRDLYSDKVLTQLTPIVQFEGGDYVLVTPQMAGVARRELGPKMGNLAQARYDIIGALDFLLTGV